MKIKIITALAAGSLLITTGCFSTPSTPTAPTSVPQQEAPTTTQSYIEKNKAALQALGEAITEKDISDDIAKMKTKDSIKSGTRIKFTGGSASTNALMVEATEAAKLAEVKAEIKGQYDELTKISSSIRVVWLDGDATTVSLVYYKIGDETIANKVLAALGGKNVEASTEPAKDEASTTTTTPAAEPEKTTSGFKVGETVLANWKAGSMWWEAKVTKVEGSKISVKYTSDNSDDTLDASAVAHKPTSAAKVSGGESVVAKWNGGSFYTGTVKSVSGSTATVEWTDKTTSSVALTDIGFPGK